MIRIEAPAKKRKEKRIHQNSFPKKDSNGTDWIDQEAVEKIKFALEVKKKVSNHVQKTVDPKVFFLVFSSSFSLFNVCQQCWPCPEKSFAQSRAEVSAESGNFENDFRVN